MTAMIPSGANHVNVVIDFDGSRVMPSFWSTFQKFKCISMTLYATFRLGSNGQPVTGTDFQISLGKHKDTSSTANDPRTVQGCQSKIINIGNDTSNTDVLRIKSKYPTPVTTENIASPLEITSNAGGATTWKGFDLLVQSTELADADGVNIEVSYYFELEFDCVSPQYQ